MCTLPMSSLPLSMAWMRNSRMVMRRRMMVLTALMAASTGPLPEEAASKVSPAIVSATLATERTPTPEVTCR